MSYAHKQNHIFIHTSKASGPFLISLHYDAVTVIFDLFCFFQVFLLQEIESTDSSEENMLFF